MGREGVKNWHFFLLYNMWTAPWITLQVSHHQGWKTCQKMRGKINSSMRLKQFDDLTRLTLTAQHILRHIYATAGKHTYCEMVYPCRQWCRGRPSTTWVAGSRCYQCEDEVFPPRPPSVHISPPADDRRLHRPRRPQVSSPSELKRLQHFRKNISINQFIYFRQQGPYKTQNKGS